MRLKGGKCLSKQRHLLAVASQNFIDPSACLKGTTKRKDKERSYEPMSVCAKPLKRKQAMTAMETGGQKRQREQHAGSIVLLN